MSDVAESGKAEILDDGDANLAARFDGLINLATGLGDSTKDKRLGASWQQNPKLPQGELEAMFRSGGLVPRICELPAGDMTRKGFELTDLEPEVELATLNALDALGMKPARYEGLVWSSLFGGAGMLLGIDDGRDMREPVDENNIKAIRWQMVLDRWDLPVLTYLGGASGGPPETYQIASSDRSIDPEDGEDFGTVVHASRVVRFEGVTTTWRQRLNNSGWDDGIIERTYNTIRDFAQAHEGVAHLLTDIGQTVMKIEGLAAMMVSAGQADGSNALLARLLVLSAARSIVGIIPLDTDEELERKGTPMTDVPQSLDRLANLLSAETGIPITKLMGQSPGGLNSGGESETTDWDDLVSAWQGRRLLPVDNAILRLLFLSKEGPTGGDEPEAWRVAYKPLRQPSEKEVEETKKTKHERHREDILVGLLAVEESRPSLYGGDDSDVELLDELPVPPMPGEEGADDLEQDVDVDDEGDADDGVDPDEVEAKPEIEGEAVPPDTALAGVQYDKLKETVFDIQNGKLNKKTAARLIAFAYPTDLVGATDLLSDVEEGEPEAPAPPPPAAGGPPPVPAPTFPPAEDDDEDEEE